MYVLYELMFVIVVLISHMFLICFSAQLSHPLCVVKHVFYAVISVSLGPPTVYRHRLILPLLVFLLLSPLL